MDPFSSALLGAVVGELLKVVINASEMAINFKSDYESLKSTVESTSKIIADVEKSIKSRDSPTEIVDKFIEKLKKGKEMILNYSTVSRWNAWSRYRCSKAIRILDSSIQKFIDVELKLDGWRDGKLLLEKADTLERKLDLVLSLGSSSGGGGGGTVLPKIPELMVGWEVPLRELKAQLFRDGVSVLVLSGPGGCGKSTLASKLCQDVEVKGIYKKQIFFVTISNTPNLKASIQTLFEDMVGDAPPFLNDEDAIRKLENLLSKRCEKPVLLVLDDVWLIAGSLLQKFLLGLRVPECKILVTSRFMLPEFGSTYSLKLLSDESAMALFRHLAFPEGENFDIIDDDLVTKIVKACNGFPLALEVIANSLLRQPKLKWQKMEKELSKGQSVLDSNKFLLDQLSTSLEFLDEPVKECFIDLGSFLEDQRIPSSALMDMWSELYDLDEGDVLVNLHELYSKNLANIIVSTGKTDLSDVDECYNEIFITQHDMLRELAIYKSSRQSEKDREKIMVNINGNNLPKFLTEHMHRSFRAQLLSISTDEKLSSSWGIVEFPQVEVLILNFLTRDYVLPKFMETMHKLKCLIVSNHGIHPSELSNFATMSCFSNIKRMRFEKISIPSLNEITIEMKNLQKISFVFCRIGHTLKNCTVEISKVFPNVEEIEIDYGTAYCCLRYDSLEEA